MGPIAYLKNSWGVPNHLKVMCLPWPGVGNVAMLLKFLYGHPSVVLVVNSLDPEYF